MPAVKLVPAFQHQQWHTLVVFGWIEALVFDGQRFLASLHSMLTGKAAHVTCTAEREGGILAGKAADSNAASRSRQYQRHYGEAYTGGCKVVQSKGSYRSDKGEGNIIQYHSGGTEPAAEAAGCTTQS